jgi:hypothetical protein
MFSLLSWQQHLYLYSDCPGVTCEFIISGLWYQKQVDALPMASHVFKTINIKKAHKKIT